ncbi:MAG: hypothetical protein K8T26_00905 [Lentisphaerae bacterium]|nr:hypothetical protein [Lentisphaerota bacterium]
MSELLLCLVAVCMVIWILLLMSENSRLKREVAELKSTVKDRLDQATGGVEVRAGRRLTRSEVDRASRPAGRQR